MKNGKVILTVVLSTLSHVLFGQKDYASEIISMNEVRGSTYASYFLMDSFSKRGDSIHASECLLRINPYYLIANGTTTGNLDSELSKFKIVNATKEYYSKNFAQVYNGPQTEDFKTLAGMYEEDQKTRFKFSKSNDSLSSAVFLKDMRHCDSAHFSWLLSYVRKKGWPTLKNGSEFASIMALHDGDHFCDYLPYLKKAVFSGDVDYKIYNKVLCECESPSDKYLLEKYPHKIFFDVSYILKGKEPSDQQVAKMMDSIRTHLPIKFVRFAFLSQHKADHEKFLKDAGSWYINEPYWIAYRLAVKLVDYQRELLHMEEQAPFDTR